MRRFLESIDVFDKLSEDEYRIRTLSGAILSLFLSAFGTFLFLAQVVDQLVPELTRTLGASRAIPGERTLVNISLSITVTLPCHLLRLDTRDALGLAHLYANTVTYRRYLNGVFIGNAAAPNASGCGSCAGLRPSDECCNSCEELVLLHKFADLPPPSGVLEQCGSVNVNERCLLKGKLTVNRVPGSFGIRVNRPISNVTQNPLNLSHSLQRIRFGPKVPGTSTPLEQIRVIERSYHPLRYHYDLVCTPVTFVSDNIIVAKTFEYTPIAILSAPTPDRPPGLFFSYQFVPYAVTVHMRTRPFSSFVAASFGVLSGGFAITALLDRLLYRESSQTPID
jgi:hypothetical protein